MRAGWIRIESVTDCAASLFLDRLFSGFIAGLLEVDHFQVHLNDLLHVLQEVMLPALQVQDLRLRASPSPAGHSPTIC